jgi:hypothetical protein
MKKLLATIGLAACLPTGLAAEDPAEQEVALGTTNVLVIEESTPVAKDILCARNPSDPSAADCMAVHRAVLTARIQKISARERSRWM